MATTALTVVLPTPPFPATMRTRVDVQNARESNPPSNRMRRRQPTIAITIVLAVITLVFLGQGAAAAAPSGGHRVDIVKVTGLIDPINVDLVSNSIGAAERQHALLLVLQLSSTGGTVSPATINRLAQKIIASPVPVAVWVGGSAHARAYGEAFTLLRAAAFTGEAPGSRVGNGPPPPGGAPSGLEHTTLSGDDAVDRASARHGPADAGRLPGRRCRARRSRA